MTEYTNFDDTDFRAKLIGRGQTVYTIANDDKIRKLHVSFLQHIRFVCHNATLTFALTLAHIVDITILECGSTFAHQIDFRLYKLTAKQRRVLQNGRENRMAYIDEHKWQEQLHEELIIVSDTTTTDSTTEETEKTWAD